jgi:hypothetical protein
MNEANDRTDATCCLVVTTIGHGEFLADYYAAILREQASERVSVIVVPDRKSPAQLYDRCAEFALRGMRVQCPTLAEQECYLARHGFSGLVPFDSDNRRNVGYLMALESGCDFVVSIDDDNYCRPGEDFFSEHAVVAGGDVEGVCVNSSERFFNICDLLEVVPTRVYPRGFPYKHRNTPTHVTRTIETGPVRLNAGLWLHEPDLDAMTWLVSPVRATRFKGVSVLLGDNAWAPINTQNTALHRDVLFSYYFARMGCTVGAGMTIDRYGDILSGYFAQACVRHMGHRIRVGTPCVDHRRNAHNYMKDATHEMGCVWMIEDLADWLVDLKLQGGTYADAYLSLADALDDAAERFTGFIWTDATRGYLHQTAYCMRRWTRACEAACGAGTGVAGVPAAAEQAFAEKRLAAA